MGDVCDEADPTPFPTDVTLSYDDGVFSGVVTEVATARRSASAVVPGCISGRAMKVKRALAGPDKVIGNTITDSSGAWSIEAGRHLRGRFYAQAERATIPEGSATGVCRRARSDVLQI